MIYAIRKKQRLKKTKNIEHGVYPVYFSESDTSGEKSYEEFHTDDEQVNFERHIALGVVTSHIPKRLSEINNLLSSLKSSFANEKMTKEDIVLIMKNFLINFDHKETGKSLDSKM